MNRTATAALVFSCLVAGYALAGTRVSAVGDQGRDVPNAVSLGSRVTVMFDGGNTNLLPQFDCTIAEVNNGWFRCATGDQPPGGFLGKSEVVWWDLNHVAMIKKVIEK